MSLDIFIVMGENKKELLKEKDLMKMIGQVLARWKFVLVVATCFAVLGIVIAVSTVKTYTVDVVVAPEASSSSSSSGLSSIASMVGLDLGAGASDEALYPMLYPDIAGSLPFLAGLLDVQVKTLDGSIDTTYLAYKKVYEKRTWLDAVKSAPSDMVSYMKSLFTSGGNADEAQQVDADRLTEPQMRMLEKLQGVFDIFVDKKTNVITISFSDRDPLVAATMADTITNRLQHVVTEYRTRKAMAYCDYVEKMSREANDSLEAAQKRYADFVDRNRNVTSEHVLIEKERLEADKELKASVNTHWAQQLQLARAKVQESIPVFVTLQPASVPALPSSMGRTTMTVLITFLGVVLAVVYIFLAEPLARLRKKRAEENRE